MWSRQQMMLHLSTHSRTSAWSLTWWPSQSWLDRFVTSMLAVLLYLVWRHPQAQKICQEQVWHTLEHQPQCPSSGHEGDSDAIWRRQHISSIPARYREVRQPPNHKGWGDDRRNPEQAVQPGPASLSAVGWGLETLCHWVKATSRAGCSCKRSCIGWCIPGAVSHLKALPLARPPLYWWQVHISTPLMAALLPFLWNRWSHRNNKHLWCCYQEAPSLCNHLWANSFHFGPP